MSTEIQQRPIIFVIFALTYVGIAAGRVPRLKLNRVGIALLGAIAMMVFAGQSAAGLAAWVNWPVILTLFGFFVLSAQLRLSGFYDRIAGQMAAGTGSPGRLLGIVMMGSAGLSAFLNNDIVCYVVTPVLGAALIRRKLNPVPFLVGLALASNIGAAFTLIGNAQGILIGEVAHLSFWRYLQWCFIPVGSALGLAYLLVRRLLPRYPAGSFRSVGAEPEGAPYTYNPAHALKGLVIFIVVVALCFTRLPKEVVVLVAAGIHLASPKFRTEDLLGLVDWPILVLFMSLFVVTGAFAATGYPEAAVHGLQATGFNLAHPANEAVTTAVATMVMNNAPAVMLLLKLVPLGAPGAAYVLALANSFSGNLVLTASVANLIVAQQARRQGIAVTFRDFAWAGLPVTLVSLALVVGWAWVVG